MILRKASPWVPPDRELSALRNSVFSLGQSFHLFYCENFNFSIQIHISEVNFQKYFGFLFP